MKINNKTVTPRGGLVGLGRNAHNVEVEGSNPSPATINNIMSSSREEKMFKAHLECRSYHYKDNVKDFKEPYRDPRDNETIASISKKEIFVTRHLITGETTHSIVFKDDWYDRFYEEYSSAFKTKT